MANGAKGKGPGNVGPAVENAKKGTADPSVPVTPYTGAPGGVKVGTVSSSDGGGLVIGVYAQAVEGGVKFWVEVESGTADLRGFFLDIGAPGGPYTRAGHADNNMNGTGYTFDYGVQIGTQGAGKDVFTKATFTLNDLPGMSLAEWLDGATFGIRATSVGMDGSSVKLICLRADATARPTTPSRLRSSGRPVRIEQRSGWALPARSATTFRVHWKFMKVHSS